MMLRIFQLLILLSVLSASLLGAYMYQNTAIPLQDTLLTNDAMAVKPQSCTYHESTALDRHGALDIVTWNIHKQQDKGWQQVLTSFTSNRDLVLLQEANLSDEFKQTIRLQPVHWVLAKAFQFAGNPVGVMNLSRVHSLNTCAFRQAEPLIYYPKSLLLSYYPLSDGTQLLVANIHSVNFTLGLDDYRAQLDVVIKAMALHAGPMILAGDLNTWSDKRNQYIRKTIKKLGLTEALPRVDSRSRFLGHALDHIYYRDLAFIEAESIVTDSSDHHPLMASFRLLAPHLQ